MSPTSERQSLVLLPGLMCDRDAWGSQIRDLSDIADCTVLGWGTLGSIEAMAAEVLRVAPKTFALAGHSMGGRVAFQVYRMAPERVERIALLNTGAEARPAGEAGVNEERGRQALLEIARARGIRAMVEQWITGMLPPERRRDAELVEAINRMFERKSADVFEIQLRALLTRPNSIPVLATIRCPTLVLTGEQDERFPPAVHQQIADAIPGSRLVRVPKCGHMAPMERPDEVSAAMRTWLLS